MTLKPLAKFRTWLGFVVGPIAPAVIAIAVSIFGKGPHNVGEAFGWFSSQPSSVIR